MGNSKSKFSQVLLQSVLVLLLSAPVIVLVLALQTAPSVVAQPELNRTELARIEQLLLENTPESPGYPSVQQLHLNEAELNLLLRYGFEVMGLEADWLAAAALQENILSTDLSVHIGPGRLPLYMNLRAEFGTHDNALLLDTLYFGELKVPDRFLQFALDKLRAEMQSSTSAYEDFSQLFRNVESVGLTQEAMTVTLNWDPALIARIASQTQQLFISDKDQQLIRDHYQRIGDIVTTIPADLRAVSLNTLLVPLFTAALENSRAGSDPVAENRAIFQALAVYVNNENIATLISQDKARTVQTPAFIEVRLQRRQDLAQHLVAIAAITASAGADIAVMLSTTKEAYDARYRSGFSFSDLTANTVGVTMSRLATRDRETALIMQERLSRITNEADYMPQVGNNRDGLSETDFNAMYQDRSSAEYQLRVTEIEELVAARPLFQGLELP